MRWWCSASGAAWEWAYRPYLGAWVIAVALGVLAFVVRREAADRRRDLACGLLGIVALLAATDWPLAGLGAGYLLTAQMVRQVLIVLIAAPLLLRGFSRSHLGGVALWLPRPLTHPALAIIVANVILIAVNAPALVDPVIGSQLGSFVVDVLWLIAGLLLWSPVQRVGDRPARLTGPPACAYLVVQSVVPLIPAFFMTWADFPLYATFELSPRVVEGFDALQDQQTAAAVFQVGGGLLIWAQITYRFLTWMIQQQRNDLDRAPRRPLGGLPGATGTPAPDRTT